MNNVTVTRQENMLSTVTVGEMSRQRLQDWVYLLFGEDSIYIDRHIQDGVWNYTFTVTSVTDAAVEFLNSFDYSLFPDTRMPRELLRGIDFDVNI